MFNWIFGAASGCLAMAPIALAIAMPMAIPQRPAATPRTRQTLRTLEVKNPSVAVIAAPVALVVVSKAQATLFCNIFAKEMLLGFLAVLVLSFFLSPGLMVKGLTLAPLMLRPAIILLGLFIGVIQALIFLLLSISYVAGAIGTEE